MMRTGRIVLAEDHAILREGLRVLLSTHGGFHVVGEAADGLEAVRRVEKLDPDLILMDLSMPAMNGLEAILEIKRRFPRTRVLVLTVHRTEEHFLATLQAGADGYLLKDASFQELITAVQSVLEGKTYLSPGISAQVVEGYLAGRRPPPSFLDLLTRRERQVLKLIAEGHGNQRIADLLGVRLKTVEKHRAHLMKKLNLHGTAALTALAVRQGLVAG
jgi:DNA-binding NarL/FixJ family response regulator